MDSQHRQLEDYIAGIVMPMEDQGVDIISPEVVANMVDQQIDPENAAPSLKTYSSVMHTRQTVRKYLAKRHDPVRKAKEADCSLSLFSDELQPYYPVATKDDDGAKTSVYKQRHLLTAGERESIAKRMRKSARTLLSHADSLVAEGVSESAA